MTSTRFVLALGLLFVLGATALAQDEETPDPNKEYARRRAEIEAEDATGHWKLALWCKQKGLKTQFQAQLRKVVNIDFDHKGAREARQQVSYDGQWLSAEEAAKRKEGLYRVARNWVPEDKANVFHSDWETPWRRTYRHIELTSNAPLKDVKEFAKYARWVAATLHAQYCFGKKPKRQIPVWLFPDTAQYNSHTEPVPGLQFSYHANSFGSVWDTSTPAVITYRLAMKDANMQKLWRCLFAGHGVGQAYVQQTLGDRGGDLWFALGLGHYLGYKQYSYGIFDQNLPWVISWIRFQTRGVRIPLRQLLYTNELGENPNWNAAVWEQGALLVHLLQSHPDFKAKFVKVREELFKNGKGRPTQTLLKHIDVKALEKAFDKMYPRPGAPKKPVPTGKTTKDDTQTEPTKATSGAGKKG